MYQTNKPYTARVLDLIQSTWNCNDNVKVRMTYGLPAIDGWNRDNPLVFHTDGCGTKGLYHWEQRTFKNAVIDALAMNLNDMAMCGATTLVLQNHIILPQEDDEAIYSIVSALADECKAEGIVITGGETSIQNTMQGMDLSITVAGFGQKETKDGNYKIGDLLVGLPSSGLHSNGFTLVRQVLPFRPEFVTPTRFYHHFILDSFHQISGMNHITGGAFTKLKGRLPANADAVLEFTSSPDVFWDLFGAGISSEQMYSTFNCGYGFVVGVKEPLKEGEIIGRIVPGSGRIIIRSAFHGSTVVL